MTGESLDQIIQLLRVQDMTPHELLIACKQGYRMDTLAFTEAIAALESIGLIRRVDIVHKDHSGSTVYRLDKVRREQRS